jgi:uncharacterized protein (TIGR02452 family)
VTTAAPNAKCLASTVTQEQVVLALKKRLNWTLGLLAMNGHKAIVLGAFGCGVFGNSPTIVAKIFRALLLNRYQGAFQHVVFSILSERGENISEFRHVFKDLLDDDDDDQDNDDSDDESDDESDDDSE